MNDEKDITDYTAIKLSSTPEGEEDPTRSGFKTKEAAWRYASRWFCKGCRHLRAVALTWRHRYGIEAGEAQRATYKALKDMVKKDLSYNRPHGFEFDIDRMFGDEFGDACGCEWTVLPTEKAEKCENFGDIMEAMGAKRVFTVGENKEENNEKAQ